MDIQEVIGFTENSLRRKMRLRVQIEHEDSKINEAWKQLEQGLTPPMTKSLVALLNSPHEEIQKMAERVLMRAGCRDVAFGEKRHLPNYRDFTHELTISCKSWLDSPEVSQVFRQKCAGILVERYFCIQHDSDFPNENTGLDDVLITKLAEDRDPKIREKVKTVASYYRSMRSRDEIFEKTGMMVVPGQPSFMLRR